MSNNKVVVENAGFRAEVKEIGEGGFQAKVRLEDEGIRGKNLVLSDSTAEGLAAQLNALASAFTSAAEAVTKLVTPMEPAPEPSLLDQPPEPFQG